MLARAPVVGRQPETPETACSVPGENVHRTFRVDAGGVSTLRAAVVAEMQPSGMQGALQGQALHAADASLPARGSRYAAYDSASAETQRVIGLVELAQSGDTEAFAQ